MTGIAYYNEIDPYAATCLRNLIAAGHIAPGDVDTRDIRDVRPDDLRSYRQCHFFAGVGVWSYALRRAGWSDDRSVWTGSCPCQPFSAAGAGLGFSDERHLWPHFHWLISERQPAVVLGEQVASKDADPWIDLVCDDMEAMGYAFGAIPFPSAGVGAPHIRDRLYWCATSGNRRHVVSNRNVQRVAYADNARLEGRNRVSERAVERVARSSGVAGRLADLHGSGRGSWGERCEAVGHGQAAEPDRGYGGLAYANGRDAGAERQQCRVEQRQQPEDGGSLQVKSAGPINGFWAAADWLLCRDGKWRPVEPGTFPLAHGTPSRVGRLRAYGNAINAEAAIAWIETVMECLP